MAVPDGTEGSWTRRSLSRGQPLVASGFNPGRGGGSGKRSPALPCDRLPRMMTRRRNFLPFAGFLVCGIAFMSYPTFFARFPATRDVPWVSWLLFVLGFALVGM